MLSWTASRLGRCARVNVLSFIRPMSSVVKRRAVKIVNLEKLEANEAATRSDRRGKQSDVLIKSVLNTGQLPEEKLGLCDDSDVKIESQKEQSAPKVIELENDLKLSRYMLVVKSRTRRRKAGITLIEGKKLMNDALASGVKLEALFVSRRRDIADIALPSYRFYLYQMPYKFIEKWSDVTSPSGVLAIFQISSLKNTSPDAASIPLTVICDNIRDPGNMGAILRVLAGVGCRKVVVTKGCVDIWEPKVLRAACGGHFRVPIEYDVQWRDINNHIDDNASVYLADCDYTGGNDSNLASETVLKSDPNDIDLNVASKTGNKSDPNNIDLNVASKTGNKSDPNDVDTSISVSHPHSYSDDADTSSSTGSLKTVLSLPYYKMKIKAGGQNILVVSNESVGVSQEALDFASERKGIKVHIPLCGKVESLNVVSALSIISFEMRRQAALFDVTT